MSPAPRPARLRHIPTRERVSIDPKRWTEIYGDPSDGLEDAVRRYIVTLINDSPARQHGAIVAARRDAA